MFIFLFVKQFQKSKHHFWFSGFCSNKCIITDYLGLFKLLLGHSNRNNNKEYMLL